MSELLETRDGKVATLTMNRPEAMNAVSDEMMRAMIEAFGRLGRDISVGAIVLTGAGRGFCAGGDVKGMATRRERTYEERIEELRWKQQIPLLIRSCPKIVIAAVNGAAMGAGFSLALISDFRVVARSAKFGTSFAAIGFSGDFGISWSLTQLLGTVKARELLLLNQRISAEEANGLGLVTRLVDDDKLLEEAMAFARTIADGPTVTYAHMKRNLFAAETEPLVSVLELEAMSQSRCAMTEDHKEARIAFVEKRKPVFQGK